MKKIQIKFYPSGKNSVNLECYIAKNIFQKMKGLSNLERLGENKGMFFQFYIPWIRGFWMKNVKIPLDIIFVDKNLKVMNLYEASVEKGPLLYKTYWSKGLCKYVLETNIGFCKRNKICKGTKISIKK